MVCEKAFFGLKKYLAHPSYLNQMKPSEDLTVDLAMSLHATLTVLVWNTEEGQRPVYYTS